MPRRLGRSRWLGLILGAGVLVAWGLFLHDQIETLQQYAWQINPLAFGFGVGWGAAYFGCLALCWALLLRHFDGKASSVRIGTAVRIWLNSMMTRYIPGNVWHVVSRVALASRMQVAATRVVASATIEQVLTLLGSLVLFGLTLPFWEVMPSGRIWLVVLVPIGVLLLHPRIMGSALRLAAARLGRPELAWQYTYADLGLFLLAYSGANMFAGIALYSLLWGLGPVSLSQIPLVVGAASLAWAVGYLSFLTPSGLGVREAMLVGLLSQMYPLPVAVVASLLFRVAITLGELLAVLVGYVPFPQKTANQSEVP